MRGMGWIPAFAGMTEPSCQVVARIIPAHVFSKEKGLESFCKEQREITPVTVAPISGLKPFGKLVKQPAFLVARNELAAAL